MKIALCTISLVLMLANAVVSQSTEPQLLIEVKASGFTLGPPGEHVYLRVYDNRLVEFEDYKPSIRAFRLYKTRISAAQLASLEDQLETFTVSDIAASYPLRSPLKKIVRLVKIRIPQPNGFQAVEIVAGGAAPAERSETKPLIELLCRIERARGKARLRLVDLRKCKRWR